MIPAIIPYYKNKSQLARCISYLEGQTVPVEIFVRDNDRDNVYYTAAVNEGIKKYLDQPYKYILILNQDMYLERTAVERMAAFMDSHPDCGIGAPLQLHSGNPDYVIFAGGCEAFPLGRHQHGPLQEFTEDKEILWANGACMILRREMIREIGVLDENYVLIGSDSDYCFAARSRGWQVWRIAGARGIHECGASGKLCEPNVELLKIKDMIYFGQKWLTGELYQELSHKGAELTPEWVSQVMNDLQKAQAELEQMCENVVTAGR
ncbi:MAG: glycosyltransferase family 2 protein [Phycisphaerales bacterium]|nr:MAG: glycosyltransferase family 2 protein [Phycisphaerales bacterium]